MSNLSNDRIVTRIQFSLEDGNFFASFTDEKVLVNLFEENLPGKGTDHLKIGRILTFPDESRGEIVDFRLTYTGPLLDTVYGWNSVLVGDPEQPSNLDINIIFRPL
jgi:hypothetical protein